jgi:hypothetical protein
MQRDRRFAGRPLCVLESFEERNTGASSSCHGRGLSCRFRRGREPAGDSTVASARLLLQLLQGCLESRHWFRIREDVALAQVAVRFLCTQ